MTLSELHPIWREALATHEIFRAIGFHPDDIFLGRHRDGRLMIYIESASYGILVTLKDTLKSFEFKDRPMEDIAREWGEAGALWNAGPDEELQAIYRGSRIFAQAPAMVHDMSAAGVYAPILADA